MNNRIPHCCRCPGSPHRRSWKRDDRGRSNSSSWRIGGGVLCPQDCWLPTCWVLFVARFTQAQRKEGGSDGQMKCFHSGRYLGLVLSTPHEGLMELLALDRSLWNSFPAQRKESGAVSDPEIPKVRMVKEIPGEGDSSGGGVRGRERRAADDGEIYPEKRAESGGGIGWEVVVWRGGRPRAVGDAVLVDRRL